MGISAFKQATSRAMGIGLGAAFLLAATAAPAANIEVTSTADVIDSAAPCTLREAITNANNAAAAPNGCLAGDAALAHNISFASNIQNSAITLTGELPTLGDLPTSPLTITGPITIDANQQGRILTNNGTTTLVNLTLLNGLADGAGNPANSGGAILNSGTLTVNGGAMNNNSSTRAQ